MVEAHEANLDATGFEQLAEGSPDGIVLHLDRCILYANPTAARILGYDDAAELVGVALSDFLDSHALASVSRRISRILATGENVRPIGLLIKIRGGQTREIEVKSAPFKTSHGRTAIQTVIRDLTDSRLNEARYRTLVDHSAETVVVLDLNGTVTYANPGWADALGYRHDAVLGRTALDFLRPEHVEELMRDFSELVNGGAGASRTIALDLIGADGTFRTFEGVANNLIDDPFVAGVMISLRDVTSRRAAERRLAGQSQVMSLLAEGEPVERILEVVTGLVQQGIGGAACAVISPDPSDGSWRALAWWGLPPDLGAALGQLQLGHWIDGDAGATSGLCEKLTDEPGLGKWARRAARAGFNFCTRRPLLRSSDREILGMLVIFGPVHLRRRDPEWELAKFATDLMAVVMERTKANEELVRAADFDLLTSLPGRRFMVRHLGELLAEQARVAVDTSPESGQGRAGRRRQLGRVTLFSLDLDRFKVVNDSLGHWIGDLVIKAVAERISAVLGPDDLVARFGGDEFIICCREVSGNEEAEVLAAGISTALTDPVVVDGRAVFVKVSIGVASMAEDVDGPEALIRNADAAMYRAKELGRGRVVVYDAAFLQRARNRMEIDQDLHVALDQGHFYLDYQPIYDLRTGRIQGAEALLRWAHPERGLISPADFVPVAEESGLIIPIGEWVLDTVCHQVAEWRGLFGPTANLSVGVNMSTIQLASPGLAGMVARAIKRTKVDPADLSLEITESALLVDNLAGIEILMELRALGLHLALDDFGTGYSSLSYLRRFPVEMVKVDKGFVGGLGAGDEDDAIVAAIIFMARALGFASVAEGVETEAQLHRLIALGCDMAQGFLLGRPSSARQFSQAFQSGPLPMLDHGQTDLWSSLGPGIQG